MFFDLGYMLVIVFLLILNSEMGVVFMFEIFWVFLSIFFILWIFILFFINRESFLWREIFSWVIVFILFIMVFNLLWFFRNWLLVFRFFLNWAVFCRSVFIWVWNRVFNLASFELFLISLFFVCCIWFLINLVMTFSISVFCSSIFRIFFVVFCIFFFFSCRIYLMFSLIWYRCLFWMFLLVLVMFF